MKVSIKENVKDDFQTIFQSLRTLITDLGGLSIEPKTKIAIKPNLCALKPPESGATTDVKVVAALIKIIKGIEPTTKIYIVESDAAIRSAWEAFKALGYEELERKYDVKLINLSESKTEPVKVKNGHFFHTMHVPQILLNCELIISVAKLKTHMMEKMTCTLKNLFGLLPERRKHLYHPFISKVLYDLYNVFGPKLSLSIVDGIYSMEGKGPFKGIPRKTELLLGGDNPLATDVVAARVMDFNPMDIPHLSYVLKNSGIRIEEIEVYGETDYRLNFKFVPKLSYLLERFMTCTLMKYEHYSSFKTPYKLARKALRKIRRFLKI